MYEITKQWLQNNKTPNGGYNRKQIESIGLTWPVRKGWQELLIGAQITQEQKQQFEHCALRGNKKQQKQQRKQLELTESKQRAVSSSDKVMTLLEELNKRFASFDEFMKFVATAVANELDNRQINRLEKMLSNQQLDTEENSIIKAELSLFGHHMPIEPVFPKPREEQGGIKIAQYALPNRNATQATQMMYTKTVV